jgi:hypothetical protein
LLGKDEASFFNGGNREFARDAGVFFKELVEGVAAGDGGRR